MFKEKYEEDVFFIGLKDPEKSVKGTEARGLKVCPQTGFAMLFSSIRDNPFEEDPNSLHKGEIVKNGVKYICTRWLTRHFSSAIASVDDDDFFSSDEEQE